MLIREEDPGRQRQRQTVEEIIPHCWASQRELGSIPPLFLYQWACSRRQIDAQVFQPLTVDCHFGHAAAHQDPALVVWIMIRLPAYTRVCCLTAGRCSAVVVLTLRPTCATSPRACARRCRAWTATEIA